jgi:hypothetical protein
LGESGILRKKSEDDFWEVLVDHLLGFSENVGERGLRSFEEGGLGILWRKRFEERKIV